MKRALLTDTENHAGKAVSLLRDQGYFSQLDVDLDERLWGNGVVMMWLLIGVGWKRNIWARETVVSADLRVRSFYDPRQLSADLVDELVRDDAGLAGR